MRRVGAFLDRDGTINVEVDFLRTAEDLRLIEGAAAAIRKLNEHGVITCVISNQSGVARGYLAEDDLVAIHQRLEAELASGGAKLDAIYYCPHYPEGLPPYNIVCECRKPATGMLEKGIREFGLEPASSFVVGDRAVDILAARAIGATAILVRTGYGESSLEECRRDRIIIDYVADSIVEAADYITTCLNGKKSAE